MCVCMCVLQCVLRLNCEHVQHDQRRRSTMRGVTDDEDSRLDCFIVGLGSHSLAGDRVLRVTYEAHSLARGDGFLSHTGKPVPQDGEAQVPLGVREVPASASAPASVFALGYALAYWLPSFFAYDSASASSIAS